MRAAELRTALQAALASLPPALACSSPAALVALARKFEPEDYERCVSGA